MTTIHVIGKTALDVRKKVKKNIVVTRIVKLHERSFWLHERGKKNLNVYSVTYHKKEK